VIICDGNWGGNNNLLWYFMVIFLLESVTTCLNSYHLLSWKLFLYVLNNVWISGKYLERWRTSTIIPVLKAGKDDSDPHCCRPVALTWCICKIMEHMMNDCLVWYFLCLLRLDFVNVAVVSVMSFVLKHLYTKLLSISNTLLPYFDIEKAYDTRWKYRIMLDLYCAGLQGRLPTFI